VDRSQEIIGLEKKYVFHTYRRPDFVIDRGEGVYLYDLEGKRYLDMLSGIAVNALGYGDEEILKAIAEQSRRYLHVSNLYHMEPQARVARMLVERSFADRVFFCNSGTEAVEGAFKFARKWGRSNGRDRFEIVAFSGAFHGRTFGALAATPREHYQAPFRPLMPGVKIAEFNNLDSARQAVNDQTCAVIVEPIQGEGGVNPCEVEFLQGLRQLCDERDILLILDEVQCGLGRSGTLWAYEYYGIEPDIMTLAKPLGGGLPMGAVLATERVASCIEPGDHGSTFAANALVSTLAQVVVRRVSEPKFLADVREKGEYLGECLKSLGEGKRIVKEVRGRGLMWALELTEEAASYVERGYREGVIMGTAGPNVLRLLPPLIIQKEHIDELVEVLDRILPDGTWARE